MQPMQEKALTTKQRKALPDEIFGLPEDRSYPLTDKEHVRKAIQFFRFCPHNKRNILAININKRMKELKMTVKVSPESEFYKFMDQTPVSEAAADVYYVKNGTGFKDIDVKISSIKESMKTALMGLERRISTDASFEALVKFEQEVLDIVGSHISNTHDYGFNPLSVLNECVAQCYQQILDFISYETTTDFTNTHILHAVVEDIHSLMVEDLENGCESGVDDKIKKLKQLMENFPSLHYLAIRKVLEFRFQTSIFFRHQLHSVDKETTMEFVRSVRLMEKYALDFLAYYEIVYDYVLRPDAPVNADYITQLLMDNRVADGKAETVLKSIKNEMESQLNIIKLTNDIRTSDPGRADWDFHLSSLGITNPEISMILSELNCEIKEENVRWIDRCLTTKLDGKDLVCLNKTKICDSFFSSRDQDKEKVYYGLTNEKIYLVTKDRNNEGAYYFILLYCDNEKVPGFKNLYCDASEFDKTSKFNAIRVCFNESNDIVAKYSDALTEGIHFDEKGSIKFSFKPKKSLMDEYAENHKLLDANFKAENYDAMKTNLAVHFALINYIENSILYNKKKKISEQRKEEALKARMFAMNDFKRYMRELLKVDPTFNFTEYYETGDYGKITFNITHDDLKGIKKLFHTLMFT